MNLSLKRISRLAACALAAASLCIVLASCGGDASQKTPAQLNREYMASVNSIGSEAADSLASFSDAVAAGDLAAMRLAASDAAKKLEKIEGLAAPEPLAQVHEEYKAGAAELTGALSDYVEAYASVQNSQGEAENRTAQGANGVDAAPDNAAAEAFAAQVEDIQARYTKGIEHLSQADTLVAQLAGPEGGAQEQPQEQA